MLQLADQMATNGQLDQARTLLELLAHDPNPDVRNEALFRHAQLLEAGGRHQAAAVLLRRVLDQNPKAAAVRLKPWA